MLRMSHKYVSGGKSVPYFRTGVNDLMTSGTPPMASIWGWWNADITNIYKDGSSRVSYMRELSRLITGVPLTNTSLVSAYPTWNDNQFATRPAIRTSASGAQYITCAKSLVQPFTIYIVCSIINWNTNYWVTTGKNSVGIRLTTSPNILLNFGSGACSTATAGAGTFMLLSAVVNNASSGLRVNAGSQTTGTVGTSNPDAYFNIGAVSSGANMNICECLVYSVAHDSTQETDVRSYIIGRYPGLW